MARTPVASVSVGTYRDDDDNRKRLFPLWVWPLIPLVLGLLSLALAMRGNDEPRQATTDTNQAGANNQGAAAAGGAALTDMLTVVNAPNRASYVGQPATFTNVQVQSVPGDRGFWIGPDANQQMFVVIDEANAGRPEGQTQIAPGQALTLGGVIRQFPAANQIPAEWGVDAATAATQQVYLHAQQVNAGQ
jgi:hypothetical protein